jgi:hypothetical protein
MRRSQAVLSVLLLPVLFLSACERTKSATPLSPSIAGPIEGVEISSPSVVSPAPNVRIASDTQPITFVIENADSNGVRPLSYLLEVATDADFSAKVFSQTGITPGEGKTSYRLPNALGAERVYYWRVKAYDGANEGEFTPPMSFTIFTPVSIGVPGLLSPADGATLPTRNPTLRVQNPAATGPYGDLYIVVEVALDGAMSNRVHVAEFPADEGQTTYTISDAFTPNTRFFWRARARSTSKHIGDWSTVYSFRTPALATGPAPSPGGGGGNIPPPSANDQIDLRQVSFVGRDANIGGWPVTSTITSAFHSGSDICIGHTKAGAWPRLPFFDTGAEIEGNQWFFAMIGGKWHGGANEWLRPGQTCKNVEGHIGRGGYVGTSMENWTPKAGELIGVAVTTPSRGGQIGGAERSNVVLIRW